MTAGNTTQTSTFSSFNEELDDKDYRNLEEFSLNPN